MRVIPEVQPDIKMLVTNNNYLGNFVTAMFYKLYESVCNTIHHLLEYTGSAFRDLVPIVNP